MYRVGTALPVTLTVWAAFLSPLVTQREFPNTDSWLDRRALQMLQEYAQCLILQHLAHKTTSLWPDSDSSTSRTKASIYFRFKVTGVFFQRIIKQHLFVCFVHVVTACQFILTFLLTLKGCLCWRKFGPRFALYLQLPRKPVSSTLSKVIQWCPLTHSLIRNSLYIWISSGPLLK